MVTKISLSQLEQIPFFAGISPESLSNLSQSISSRTRPPRSGVYFPGDTADSVFFLVEGRLKLGNVGEEGREVIKRVVVPGEMFGEASLFSTAEREEFAIPMKMSAVFIAVRAADLRHAINGSPELTDRLIQYLGQRVKVAESMMEDYVLKDSRTRIIEFILDKDKEARSAGADSSKAYHFMTHQDIAGITGASRQFVTGVMNELRKLKLIDFNRVSVQVKDRKGLEKAI